MNETKRVHSRVVCTPYTVYILSTPYITPELFRTGENAGRMYTQIHKLQSIQYQPIMLDN